jgi:hypothetical protein
MSNLFYTDPIRHFGFTNACAATDAKSLPRTRNQPIPCDFRLLRCARLSRLIRIFLQGVANECGKVMRIITRTSALVAALLTVGAVTAVAEESVGAQVKEAAKETGEAIKDTAKTIGEKTKEAWRETKAYASEDRPTYHKGAGQRLSDLKSEIGELKSRRSEAANPEALIANALSCGGPTSTGALGTRRA